MKLTEKQWIEYRKQTIDYAIARGAKIELENLDLLLSHCEKLGLSLEQQVDLIAEGGTFSSASINNNTQKNYQSYLDSSVVIKRAIDNILLLTKGAKTTDLNNPFRSALDKAWIDGLHNLKPLADQFIELENYLIPPPRSGSKGQWIPRLINWCVASP